MPIVDFEKILIYLITVTFGGIVKMRGINVCLLYHSDICHYFKEIPLFRQEMLDNSDEIIELLKNQN